MVSDKTEVWSAKTGHVDDLFQSLDPEIVLDIVRERVDDWMRSPISDGESLTITIQYRDISPEKLQEWMKHGLI